MYKQDFIDAFAELAEKTYSQEISSLINKFKAHFPRSDEPAYLKVCTDSLNRLYEVLGDSREAAAGLSQELRFVFDMLDSRPGVYKTQNMNALVRIVLDNTRVVNTSQPLVNDHLFYALEFLHTELLHLNTVLPQVFNDPSETPEGKAAIKIKFTTDHPRFLASEFAEFINKMVDFFNFLQSEAGGTSEVEVSICETGSPEVSLVFVAIKPAVELFTQLAVIFTTIKSIAEINQAVITFRKSKKELSHMDEDQRRKSITDTLAQMAALQGLNMDEAKKAEKMARFDAKLTSLMEGYEVEAKAETTITQRLKEKLLLFQRIVSAPVNPGLMEGLKQLISQQPVPPALPPGQTKEDSTTPEPPAPSQE